MSLPLSAVSVSSQPLYKQLASTIESCHVNGCDASEIPAIQSSLTSAVTECIHSIQSCHVDNHSEKRAWILLLCLLFEGSVRDSDAPFSEYFAQHGHSIAGETPTPATTQQQSQQPGTVGKGKGKKPVKSSPAPPSSAPSVNYSYVGSCAQVDIANVANISTLLIDLINHFHDEGGYQTLILSLSATPSLKTPNDLSSPPSPLLIAAILRLIHCHSSHWTEAFSSTFSSLLTTTLNSSLSSYTETQMKLITKTNFDSIFTQWLAIIANSSKSQAALTETIWKLKLELSWKLLTGEVFEKRILAINAINEAIDATHSTQTEKSSLSISQFQSFLTSHNLIDYLLSMTQSHAELLKRCSSLLSFTIQQQLLNDSHLQLLTNWLTSDHDHTLSIVQTLLLNLSSMFDYHSNIRLYQLMMNSIEPAAMTVTMLQFFHSFAMRVLIQQSTVKSSIPTKSIPEGQWIGLVTFFTIFELSCSNNSSVIRPSVALASVSLLQSMLKHSCCQSQRDYYANACINNIKNGVGSDQSLNILQSIISSFPAMVGVKFDPQHQASQAEYVAWLEQKYLISNVVIESANKDSLYANTRDTRQSSASNNGNVTNNYGNYNNNHNSDELRITLPLPSPAAAHVASTPSISSSGQNNFHRQSNFSFDSQTASLNIHFNFLLTLYRASTLTLSNPQAQRLWRDHFIHGFSVLSRHSLCNFLSSLLNSRARSGNQRAMIGYCIDDSVCLYLLDQCLCSIPMNHFDRNIFQTFELYFLHVNAHQNLLSSYDLKTMNINSWSLHGIDELWNLIVSSKEKQVVDSAATLILKIYQSKSSISQIGANHFIKQCFSYMNSSVQPLASFSAAQVYSPRTPEQSPSPQVSMGDEDENENYHTGNFDPTSPNSMERLSMNDSTDSVNSATSPSHNDGVDEEDEAARNDRTARCLKLLSLFIKGPIAITGTKTSATNSSSSSSSPHTTSNSSDDSILVFIQWKAGVNSSWSKASLTLQPNTTIAAIRQHAAPLLSHPASYIDFMGTATSHFNNKIVPDTTLINTIPTQAQTKTVTLTAIKRAMPDTLQPTCLSSTDSPALILSQNLQFYQKLFELLAPKHPVVLIQPAYTVLTTLPVNTTLFNAIIAHQLTWKRLLPFHSPLQLLHTLSIINDIISPQLYENEIIHLARESWMIHFIESGGLIHLRDVLIKGLSIDACHSHAWMRGMRLKTFGIIVKLFVDLCHRKPQLVWPIINSDNFHSLIGLRLFDLINEASVGISSSTLFNETSESFITDCCVTTIHSCFTLIRMLLTPSPQSSNINNNYNNENSIIWQYFYSSSFGELFLQSLFYSRYSSIRGSMSSEIIELIGGAHQQSAPLTNQPSPFIYFIQTLLSALTKFTENPSLPDSGEYFSLIQELLKMAAKSNISVINEERGKSLVKLLIQLIQSRAFNETRSRKSEILKGILGFAAVLFRCDPALRELAGTEMIQLIYNECLFQIDQQNSALTAKARNQETRSQAYQTLLSLIIKSPNNIQSLLSLISAAHSTSLSRDRAIWELESESLSMKNNYVGLKNLGNTCYLNSYIQQLTMVPGFAEAILTTTVKLADDKNNSNENVGDLSGDQLFEFQSLLLPLVLSNSPSINPQQFVSNFSFFGDPINVNQQYDVQEFSSVLFDHLDEALKNTERKNLLQSFFGGLLSNEINGISCPHRHAKSEPFYLLSLNIQHHKDIRSSLKEFIKGETLAGDNAYFCSTCNNKVEAQRRSVIAELPDNLILHLKRFEFDYDTMRKKKLNSECKFPLTIDMKQFVKSKENENDSINNQTKDEENGDNNEKNNLDPVDGEEKVDGDDNGENETESETSAPLLSSERDLFDLVGIIVHSGHADGGHYYSFIKDRFAASNTKNASRSSSGQWLQFNDQRISAFSLSDLATECFGGFESIKMNLTAKEKLAMNSPDDEYVTIEKQRSAYMLLYERRIKRDTNVKRDINEGENNQIHGLQRTPATNLFGSNIAINKQILPNYLQPLLQSLSTANLSLLRVQLANEAQYVNFLFRAFLHSYDTMPRNDNYPNNQLIQTRTIKPSFALQLIQSLTFYIVHVIARAKSHRRAEAFVALLQHSLALHVPASHWFIEYLTNEFTALRQSLIESQSPVTRRLMMLAIDCALSRLVGFEIDAEFSEKFLLMPIPDKEKERAAIDTEFDPINSASPSPIPSPSSTPPPVPARNLGNSSSPSPSASPLTSPRTSISEPAAAIPAKPLALVDATLAPDQMFKVKSKVSLASPLTVLHGIGASTAKVLTTAGLTTIQLLAGVKEKTKKEQNFLLSTTKLSPKQLNEAVEKARTACAFIQQIGGDLPEVKPSISDSSVNLSVSDTKPEVPARPTNPNYVGITSIAAIPRFIHQCLALLRGLVEHGDVDGVNSTESVELLTRFAKKSPLCLRLLIEAGCIDALIALCTGESPATSSTSPVTSVTPDPSQLNGLNNNHHSHESSIVNSLSHASDLPPLPLLPAQSFANNNNASNNRANNSYDASHDQSATISLLSMLMKYCRLPHWKENQPANFIPSSSPITLTVNTQNKLTGKLFLDKLAHQRAARASLMTVNVELLGYLCFMDLSASDCVIASLLSVLAKDDADTAWCTLSMIQRLLTLGDSEELVSHRINTAMTPLLQQLHENSGFYRLTDLLLKWLFSLVPINPIIANHIYGAIISGQLDWLNSWLVAVKKPPTQKQPIFLPDGRIISLFRELTATENNSTPSVEENFPLSVTDIPKTWKGMVETANKREKITKSSNGINLSNTRNLSSTCSVEASRVE